MDKILEIQNLTKTYSNGFTALQSINLSVEKGDFIALLGPNGAGKSTTIGIISSLINKTSGSVKIDGYCIHKNPFEAKRRIGVMPQEFNFNPFEKVTDIILYQAGYYGIPFRVSRPLCERYLDELGLWNSRNLMAKDLSGGMKRRLMIARALIHKPKLLILDEPTAGVDVELRRGLLSFLRKQNEEGVSIILTTHYLEEAEMMCRNVAIINEGKIIKNTSMDQLLRQRQNETFILDLKNKLVAPPKLENFETHVINDFSIEVQLEQQQSLNMLFEELSKNELEVYSMKNKTNRLEDMFISMTNNSNLT